MEAYLDNVLSKYTADTAGVNVAVDNATSCSDSFSINSTSPSSSQIVLPLKRERSPITLRLKRENQQIRPKPPRSSSFPLTSIGNTGIVLQRLRRHHFSPSRWDSMGITSSMMSKRKNYAHSKNMEGPLQKPIRRPSPVQKTVNAMDAAAMIVQYHDDEENDESFYSGGMQWVLSRNMAKPLQKPIRRPSPEQRALNPMKNSAIIVQYQDDDEMDSFYSDAKSLSATEKPTRRFGIEHRTTNVAERRENHEISYEEVILPPRHERPSRRYCLDPATTAGQIKMAGLLREIQSGPSAVEVQTDQLILEKHSYHSF